MMPKEFRKRKFPKLRPDGSFCIEARVRVSTNELDVLASEVTNWLDRWVRENQYWKRSLVKKGKVVLDYFDDYAGLPSLLTCPPDFLILRLAGRPGARWWKDWLILRLLKELRNAFEEITALERIIDCPEMLDKTNSVRSELPERCA